MQVDTLVGMGFSNIIALFIMLTTAATLNAHGVTDIQTSSQAAEALRPIAGRFAFTIFALGIIGTGLLAVPVLAGSAAYAVGEALRWRVGLAQRPGRARAFYGMIALPTLVGAILNFTPLDPIKALFWSAVINGVAAVPIMVIIMLMASRKQVMGQFALRPLVGWPPRQWLSRPSAYSRRGEVDRSTKRPYRILAERHEPGMLSLRKASI
jgi:Mn2+/Fe2+ NRAMP family transporter